MMMKTVRWYLFIGIVLTPIAMAAAPIESLIGGGAPPTQQYTDANHTSTDNGQSVQNGQITLLNQVNGYSVH